MKKQQLACPSATNSSGASLFGVVNVHGVVSFLPEKVELTEELIELGNQSGSAESKFRYTSKCVESGCNQWTGSACGVIHQLKDLDLSEMEQKVQRCPIKQECRWFFQEGISACKICPLFVADFLEKGEGKMETAV